MVKVIEERLVDDRRQRRADATRLHALLHDEHLARLLDRVRDGLHVKGLERDQVDDLRVVALLHQLLHRLRAPGGCMFEMVRVSRMHCVCLLPACRSGNQVVGTSGQGWVQ
eukprot:200676-Chlamydomonas_euryale.AAC.7